METHSVVWGRSSIRRPLLEKEKKELLEKIDARAKNTNAFTIYVRREAVNFLKEKLRNVCIMEVDIDSDSSVLLAIGVDDVTTKALYCRI